MRTDALIRMFGTSPPGEPAYTAMAQFLGVAAPADVESFVARALAELPQGGTFFDAALSHVDESAFERLVPAALSIMASPAPAEACESLIAYASLQRPQALQPHLARLFDLNPNGSSYYSDWPWRIAGREEIARLARELVRPRSAQSRQKAWLCLLQTRIPEAVTLAENAAPEVYPNHDFTDFLREVGLAGIGQPLYADPCFHLVFPAGHFSARTPPWNPHGLHPSWKLPGPGMPVRFGGPGSGSCGLCGGALHHLLTLPEQHVFVHGSGEISLETCLSCLGWESDTLHYRHGADGRPHSPEHGASRPEFVAGPLREALCLLAPTPARWLWQDWALSNARENLNRVGGRPAWIQGAQYPDCKQCGAPMHFIAQFDSDLPDDEGGEWSWGSGGIGYAFACSSCRHTAFLWQCT
jgi:hypothetical protein